MPNFNDRLQSIAEQFGAAMQDHERELKEVVEKIEKQLKGQENEKSVQNFKDEYLKSKRG